MLSNWYNVTALTAAYVEVMAVTFCFQIPPLLFKQDKLLRFRNVRLCWRCTHPSLCTPPLVSFAGVGLAQEVVEVLVNKAKRNRKTSERWKNVEVLIIDEVSMINGVLFDKIEALARSMKKCEAPFGGIQVLISGT